MKSTWTTWGSNPGIARGLALAVFAFAAPAAAAAPDFPTKPIQIVVGTPPGGPADAAARAVAEESAKELGVPVVVTNKPGASGAVSAASVAGAKPDGYTLLVGMSMSLSAGFALLPNISYKLSDFAPVARHVIFPILIAVRTDAPWSSLKEFIEDARKNPDKYTSGSDGGGTALPWEAVLKTSNLRVAHTMYSGSAPNITALLGGHIGISATVLTPLLPQLEAKKVRLLAASGRMAQYPGVPTLHELGYTDAPQDFWNGFLAPAGTPASVVEKLSATFKRALENPATRDKLTKVGLTASYQNPAEFGGYLQKEYETYMAFAKKYKIRF
jgi:tripartite-type tricarboxylate transporter receptor subunit TctC